MKAFSKKIVKENSKLKLYDPVTEVSKSRSKSQENPQPQPLNKKNLVDIVFCLDTTSSMGDYLSASIDWLSAIYD